MQHLFGLNMGNMDTAKEIISLIKEASGCFSWPIVFLFCSLLFRSPVTSLINRITKAQHGNSVIEAPILQSPDGNRANIEGLGSLPVKTTEETASPNITCSSDVSTKSGADVFLESFDNPLIKESEARIVSDLKIRNIITPEDKEKVLVRALAATQLVLLAERIYAGIWGSQVAALRYLRGCYDGADISSLQSFYDLAKSNFPDWYKEQTFEKWIGFLTSFSLICVNDSLVKISVVGLEFLKYLDNARKPERTSG